MYPTLASLAIDVLPVQASAVPCERLFSSGKLTAGALRSRLTNKRFEQLQLLKFAWRTDLTDLAAANSEDMEEIEGFMDSFVEMVEEEEEEAKASV